MIHRSLVVDDEVVLLDLLKNVLKRYGCDVTGANDGEAAVALPVKTSLAWTPFISVSLNHGES